MNLENLCLDNSVFCCAGSFPGESDLRAIQFG